MPREIDQPGLADAVVHGREISRRGLFHTAKNIGIVGATLGPLAFLESCGGSPTEQFMIGKYTIIPGSVTAGDRDDLLHFRNSAGLKDENGHIRGDNLELQRNISIADIPLSDIRQFTIINPRIELGDPKPFLGDTVPDEKRDKWIQLPSMSVKGWFGKTETKTLYVCLNRAEAHITRPANEKPETLTRGKDGYYNASGQKLYELSDMGKIQDPKRK